MKKILAVPAIGVLAAAAAASAATFAGGVNAGPLQTGDEWDLECAQSAEVVEWGFDDSTATPVVDNALVRLNDSECQGQAVHLIALKPDGTELARFGSKRLSPGLASGTQNIRLFVNESNGSGTPVNAQAIKAVRISVDPGYSSLPTGGSN